MAIKKVFFAPLNADHPQTGMRRAFNGIFGPENCREMDYFTRLKDTNFSVELVNSEFLHALTSFEPDMAFFQLQDTSVIRVETIRKAKRSLPSCIFVKWQGDVRAEPSEYVVAMAKEMHMTCIASKGQIELYRSLGAKDVRYLQIGLDWDEDVLAASNWNPPFHVPSVLFIGNNYKDSFPGTPEREGAIRALHSAGVDIGIVGNGWEETGLPIAGQCKVKDQVRVWRKAKVALSVNHFPDLRNYWSDRHLCAMSAGVPLICRYVPGLEEEFKDGEHLFWYRDEDELMRKVRTLLADPVLALRVGSAGREEVLKNHTWFSRILTLYSWVDRMAGGIQKR